MKWKRVKGGQQGAAALEKELVNVKKGTLLPSEFSGMVGRQRTASSPRPAKEEDSHDSDQNSENPHLWPSIVLLDRTETKETLVRCKGHLYTACCEQSIPTDSNLRFREHSRDALYLGFALSRICFSQILLYLIEQSVQERLCWEYNELKDSCFWILIIYTAKQACGKMF